MKAIVLGIIQGLTEFLPVSSDGHLVVAGRLLNFGGHGPFEEVFLHLGTLVAIGIYFRTDLGRLVASAVDMLRRRGDPTDPYRRLVWMIMAGTIATGLVYLAGREFFEESFESARIAGFGFLITGGLLLLTRLARVRVDPRPLARVTFADALLIGFAQGAAIAPGVSRSGSTIATGLLRGLDSDSTVRFSFLLGFPAIVGGNLLEARHLFGPGSQEVRARLLPLLTGAVVAGVVGILALRLLVIVARRGRVDAFAYYCFAIGLLTLLFLWRS